MRGQAKAGLGWVKCLGVVVMMGLGLLALGGCDATGSGGARRPLIRPSRGAIGTPSPASGGVYDLDAIRDGTRLELPGDDPESVLKPGGRSGAWSSEARAIEKSLGYGS